jgi:hypothetical protein
MIRVTDVSNPLGQRREEVITMCVKCAISEAVNAGDWDEVGRLAREEKKAEKAEEKAEAKVDAKADDSKVSSKS